ncbi:MAG: DMT family transporter [Pikeienuella sp.]
MNRGGLISFLTNPAFVISVGASFWGLFWVPLRGAEAAGLGPGWAVAIVILPAMVAAALYLAFGPRKQPVDWSRSLVAGVFAGLGFGFYALGLVTTTVVKATLLFYLTPVWTTLIAIFVLSERPGMHRWIALSVGICGLALLVGGEDDASFSLGVGEMAGLFAGFCWSVSSVALRKAGPQEVHGVMFLMCAVSIAVMAIGSIVLLKTPFEFEFLYAALDPVTVFFSLMIFGSLISMFWAMGRMSPGRSGLLMMSEVLVAAFSAAIFIPEETLSVLEWAGAALIVAAGVVEVTGPSDA